jgi:hypothetical protein
LSWVKQFFRVCDDCPVGGFLEKPAIQMAIDVNQHAKLTRDPGKSTLNFFHPGIVQPSGIFAGATWDVTHEIHSRNQTASFCQWGKHQLDRAKLEAFPSNGSQSA